MSKVRRVKRQSRRRRGRAGHGNMLNAWINSQKMGRRLTRPLRIAEKNLDAYKCKAAEMHEELVEALENMMEWCAEYWDKDSIQELIERAKAL